jgi:SPP1 gp7 family putative phage head morphogenesis protein
MARSLDPSRTTTLRRAFMSDIFKRVQKIKKSINRVLVDLDVFGLKETPNPLKFNMYRREYEFKTDPEKLDAFQIWLQAEVDAGILEVATGKAAWTQKYIQSSYQKGVVRAYIDTHKEALAESSDFYQGTKAQFLSDVFTQPETVSKVQMLYTRTFDQLKGFTAQMAADTSRILSNGLSNGYSPKKIARELTKQIDSLTKKRALTIARTEIVRAHAEGQLDSFEKLGVEKVGVEAEFSTAGDDLVCEICLSLEGDIVSTSAARGIIPVHPSCRCAWIPHLK